MLHARLCQALALLSHRNDPPQEISGPYVVCASYGPSGIQLWLPSTTLLRVPRSASRSVRILVPYELLHSGAPFNILRECAVELLGLSEADLSREDGFEIIDPRTGKTLARYPASSTS